MVLKANETLDDLIIGNLKIIQPIKGYRFSIDAVLLTHFPDLSAINQVVDLGTGSGVIPLLLSQRSSSLQITGVELQLEMVERAQRSVRFNSLEDRIKIIQADIRNIKEIVPGGSAELVLSNPPFWKQGQGHINKNQEEAIARHELELTLDEVVEAGAYLLAKDGRMAIIHRAERLNEIKSTMSRHRLFINRIRPVLSYHDHEATLVLVEACKAKVTVINEMAPMVIYTRPQEYSEEVKRLYGETRNER